MRILLSHFVPAAFLLYAAAGCSKATKEGSGAGGPPVPASETQAGGTKTKGYPYTSADVQFMSHMIAHHAQALIMARLAQSNGASSTVQTLAGRIINGQQDEIATMQRWLKDRGQPVPDPTKPMQTPTHNTGGHGQDHPVPMPGMLTEAQMKELEQARGTEFDRLFLTYMIQHHKGAVTMVDQLFGTEGAAQEETTFKLANDVSVDQTTEIARMQRMLDGLQSSHNSP